MKPLIFIHGFLGSRNDFNFSIEGYTNFFYEIPFHGKNKTQLDHYDLNYLSEDFEKFLIRFNTPWVWGYSLGGRILQKVMERSRVKLAGAILESSGFSEKNGENAQERIQKDSAWSKTLCSVPIYHFLDQWYSQDLFKSLKNHPKYLEILNNKATNLISSDSFNENKNIAPSPCLDQHPCLDQQTQDLYLPELQRNGLAKILREASPALNPLPPPSTISIPTLAIVGQLDSKYSKLWSPWIDKNPILDIRILKNTGHAIHTENSQLAAQCAQDWLKKQTR